MYPAMIGKRILDNDPAAANHPCNGPCDILPTTVFVHNAQKEYNNYWEESSVRELS